MTLAVPYGRHAGQGHLVMSVNDGGASPTHQIKFRQALCEGPIDSLEGVWYAGTRIETANFVLYDGSQTTAPAAPFALDFAHHKTAMLQVTLPVGMADANVTDSPPDKIETIGKFLKVDNYDSSGAVTATAYSPSPARVVADLIHTRSGEHVDRTNWTRWTAWRDYLGTTETVDYTTIADFDGVGLRAKYYSDNAFTTLVSERIDPSIFFDTSSGGPALDLGDDFSVEWTGKIKTKGAGVYNFAFDHDDSIKLWVDDLVTPLIDVAATAVNSNANKTLAANTLYNIKIRWVETGGNAQCVFRWTPRDLTGVAESIQNVPQQYLYPESVSQPRYEAHALFENATDPDTAVRQVLAMSNSIVQMADGKRNFYCIEELSPVMAITEAHIKDGTFNWYRRDRRELRNHWEATYRDLESQYLEVAQPPVTVEFPELQDAVGRVVSGQAIDLDNMTHWQAYKVLQYISKRETGMDLMCEFDGLAATYKVLPGDLVTLTHSQPGWTTKQFLVLETTDYSAEDTPDRRNLVLMEWT